MPQPSVNPAAATELVDVNVGDLRCLCRPELASSIESAYKAAPWIYDVLAQQEGSKVLRGRRPVISGELNGTKLVVKRMFHGGLLARLSGDAFLTPARAKAHIELADYLTAHGIKTPRVAFVSWRRVRGLVRCEVGFDLVDQAIDADRYFFHAEEVPEDFEARSERIGALVGKLHRIGFLHADLNLMNFLFASGGETYILDLDKTVLHQGEPSESARMRNLERLERSIRKQGRHRFGVVDRMIRRIRTSYRAALAVLLFGLNLHHLTELLLVF